MKQLRKISMITGILILGLSMATSSCDKNNDVQALTGDNKTITEAQIDSTSCPCIINPADSITPEEVEMIRYMREEEKLARDVYSTLYSQYQMPVFTNISKSEQVHMDRVLCLLIHYNIPDPASTEPGVFTNADLQELYNQLVEQGSASLTDALTVGATIEDLDIYDLAMNSNQTGNEAILNIFGKLSCASGNHLHSFSTLLERHDVTYAPQYISAEEYEAIINAGHQFCGGPCQ